MTLVAVRRRCALMLSSVLFEVTGVTGSSGACAERFTVAADYPFAVDYLPLQDNEAVLAGSYRWILFGGVTPAGEPSADHQGASRHQRARSSAGGDGGGGGRRAAAGGCVRLPTGRGGAGITSREAVLELTGRRVAAPADLRRPRAAAPATAVAISVTTNRGARPAQLGTSRGRGHFRRRGGPALPGERHSPTAERRLRGG